MFTIMTELLLYYDYICYDVIRYVYDDYWDVIDFSFAW